MELIRGPTRPRATNKIVRNKESELFCILSSVGSNIEPLQRQMTVLEHSLKGVTDEGGAETLPETPAALLGNDGVDARHKALVLSRVHLQREV